MSLAQRFHYNTSTIRQDNNYVSMARPRLMTVNIQKIPSEKRTPFITTSVLPHWHPLYNIYCNDLFFSLSQRWTCLWRAVQSSLHWVAATLTIRYHQCLWSLCVFFCPFHCSLHHSVGVHNNYIYDCLNYKMHPLAVCLICVKWSSINNHSIELYSSRGDVCSRGEVYIIIMLPAAGEQRGHAQH